MSDLRTAAQQALNVLESHATHGPLPGRCPVRAAEYALRTALAQQDKCEWVQDGYEESDTWQASCSGRYFMLEDGTPKDNHMTHCCYCGKTLSEVPFEQDDSDE
jgi:hypothetical protein